MLFNDGTKNYGKFDFTKDDVTISDWSSNNKETIKFTNECAGLTSYSALLNIDNLLNYINFILLNGIDEGLKNFKS